MMRREHEVMSMREKAMGDEEARFTLLNFTTGARPGTKRTVNYKLA